MSTSGDGDRGGGFDVNDIIVASMFMTSDPATSAKPKPAEAYGEPDYGALWSRRWRVIRVALLVIAVLLMAALVTFSRPG